MAGAPTRPLLAHIQKSPDDGAGDNDGDNDEDITAWRRDMEDREDNTELPDFRRRSSYVRKQSFAEQFPPDSVAGKLFRRTTTTRQEYGGSPLRRFWRRQVHLSVPHRDCRDHLALERTYLGYLRTSLALTNSGVTIAQLFRLQDSNTPLQIGFYNLGKPVAVILICSGIITCVCGGWRFWRQQNALARGKIHASGWDFVLVGTIVVVVIAMLFAIVLGVNVDDNKKDPEHPLPSG